MIRRLMPFVAIAALCCITLPAEAQGRGGRGGGGRGAGAPVQVTDQTVIGRIWNEGMTDKSQAAALAQTLLDSIGPRLTGSPGMEAASRWVISKYQSWGIPARAERYGTWAAWRRGPTHIDLIAPRVRTLEGMMLAWSPPTPGGRPVEGEVVLLPDVPDSAAFTRWLGTARGKFVMLNPAQVSCRMASQWEEFGTPASIEAVAAERAAAAQAWQQRLLRISGERVPELSAQATPQDMQARNQAINAAVGRVNRAMQERLQQAGAAGVFTMNWSQYPGINKIFGSPSQRVPTLDLSCEDYGLLFRLAQNNQAPRVRVSAQSESLGERPVFNTIGEIKGTEKPNEYVILSAHFDSWDGSSGATDNGTGTITMMEAMRILKAVYPNPKRTILVGHWNGEEQGLNGSRAFSEDHPEIVKGLQMLFNQDNGTGRIVNMTPGGIAAAGPALFGYLQQIPTQITGHITFRGPGSPATGGSDNAAFACHGTAAIGLGALSWDYSNTTWHTNRDTYDKIVIDDLRNNATLTAMLAYLASEDPQFLPRDPAVNAVTGQRINFAQCPKATRSSQQSNR